MRYIEDYKRLLKIRVDHQGGNQWYLKPEFTKNGPSKSLGHYIFRGDDEAFRKYLIRMKASDTESDPPSVRSAKYADIVQKMKEPKRTYVWAYSHRWKSANKIMGESVKRVQENVYEVLSHVGGGALGDLKGMVFKGYRIKSNIYLNLENGNGPVRVSLSDVKLLQFEEGKSIFEGMKEPLGYDSLKAAIYDIVTYGATDDEIMQQLKYDYDRMIGQKLIKQAMKDTDTSVSYFGKIVKTLLNNGIKVV